MYVLSQPIFEATTCFDEDTTDAYTQAADETTVKKYFLTQHVQYKYTFSHAKITTCFVGC